jgi:hypothetical protein
VAVTCRWFWRYQVYTPRGRKIHDTKLVSINTLDSSSTDGRAQTWAFKAMDGQSSLQRDRRGVLAPFLTEQRALGVNSIRWHDPRLTGLTEYGSSAAAGTSAGATLPPIPAREASPLGERMSRTVHGPRSVGCDYKARPGARASIDLFPFCNSPPPAFGLTHCRNAIFARRNSRDFKPIAIGFSHETA